MAPQRPFLEVQIHAEDIRHGVRYLFLTRAHLAALAALVALALALVVWTVAITPRVIRNAAARHQFSVLAEARTQHGERLLALIERLDELQVRTEAVSSRMQKVYLAYGLSNEESSGQGGFPVRPAPVPDSIYAGTILYGNTLTANVTEQMQVLGAFIKDVQAFEEEHSEQVHSTPSISPLKSQQFVLTSPFGTRRNPFTKGTDFHAGIDLAAATGTPIHAPAAGVVVFAGRYDLRASVAWWRYGNLVVLRHGDRFISLFGHCDEVFVKAGKQVRQGEAIASVGNTGWSTNPHLHYEIRRKFAGDQEYEPVDPRIYILDHRWRDEERLLVRARSAPSPGSYEPLPRRFSR